MIARLSRAARVGCAAVALALGGASAADAHDAAAAAPVAAPHRPNGFVEAGAGYAALTGANPSWNDEYVRAHVAPTAADAVDLEATRQAHFGDRGNWFGGGYTRILDERWYATASGGASDGGFFLPRYRVDGFLSRKWLAGAPLVTTVGLGWIRSRDVHSDRTLLLEATYWFRAPFVLDAGARLNLSDPGTVVTARGFAALTYGTDQHHQLTLRVDGGGEGYQLVAENVALTRFSSWEATAIWRQWLTRRVGLDLQATRYANPTYARTGVQLGAFWEF